MSRESSVPADGRSRTVTQTQTATGNQNDEAGPSDPVVGVLKLRGDRSARRQKVVFSEGTVDNEGMGKKKSKSEYSRLLDCLIGQVRCSLELTKLTVCCIYHKPRAYDESSDESSSDESDCGHDHHKPNAPRHATARKVGKSAEAHEQTESSESEGGGGDGRAR